MASRSERREWWERIVLRHVAACASHYRAYRLAGVDDVAARFLERIAELGELLQHMRRERRRRALAELRRVSEGLGLYEEDVEDAV